MSRFSFMQEANTNKHYRIVTVLNANISLNLLKAYEYTLHYSRTMAFTPQCSPSYKVNCGKIPAKHDFTRIYWSCSFLYSYFDAKAPRILDKSEITHYFIKRVTFARCNDFGVLQKWQSFS